jgi:predicted nucleic acid-binding protein
LVQPRYIADNSAVARQHHAAVRDVLAPLVIGGLVARCGISDLEALFSCRGPADLRATRREQVQALPLADTAQVDFDRAAEVMLLLAEDGKHRAVPVPDLIISAVAERHGLTILHYDQDFDCIASVTGQSARWIVPRGSVP